MLKILKIILSLFSLTVLFTLLSATSNNFEQYNKSKDVKISSPTGRSLETFSKSDAAVESNTRSDNRIQSKERTSSRTTKRY